MMHINLLDENDLSDISLDFSPEAEDSGIDACEGERRSLRNYDPESSSESEREREREMFLKHMQLRDRLQYHEVGYRVGSKKSSKLYAPQSAAQVERHGIAKQESDDDESILEVELTASGEDDDSSVLELVIPMQKNKFPKRVGLGVFQMICNVFCCKTME